MTTQGSKGLGLPAKRGISSGSRMQYMKVRGGRGNIFLLNFFLFSHASVESSEPVESKAK